MDFSKALTALKNGQKVRMKPWKYTYLEVGHSSISHPVIFLCKEPAAGEIYREIYSPSQHDLFAEDWEVVQEDINEKYERMSKQLQDRLDEEGDCLVKELLNIILGE